MEDGVAHAEVFQLRHHVLLKLIRQPVPRLRQLTRELPILRQQALVFRARFGNLLIQRDVIVVFLLHLLLLRKDFRHRFAVLAFHAPNQIQPCLNFLRPNGVELPFFGQIRQFVADFLQLIVR